MIARNDPRNYSYTLLVFKLKADGSAQGSVRPPRPGLTLPRATQEFDNWAAKRSGNGERQYAPAILAVRI